MIKSKFKKIIATSLVIFVALVLVVISPKESFSETVETFTTSGTWDVPDGVTSVTVECWGGGGSGGGGTNSSGAGGGGGAGGQYSIKEITIDQASYNYVIAAVASGVSRDNNGNTGNDTTFGGTLVVAKGGAGGQRYADGGAGGAGSTSGGVGDTIYAGGSGASKGTNYGGGGGSGAGSTGAGNSASGVTGGVAKTENGGAGGNGYSGTNGSGYAGSNYGGGGGGPTRNGTSGGGAQGYIRLTYTQASVPDAPTGLTATAGAEQIDLAWTTPVSDGGSAITGYNIYRDTVSPATTYYDTVGVTNSYNDSIVSAGIEYFYRVKATNAVGDSDYSNEDSATPYPAIDLSGIVYQSEGGSNIGSGKIITVYKNGSTDLGSDETDANGIWALTGLNISLGDIINVYINGDETYKGSTVFVSDGNDQTNIDVYGGALILRHDTGSNITNANLSTGRVSDDSNDMMYSISGSDLTATSSAEIHIWTGNTYVPGGKVMTQGTSGHFHLDDNANTTLATTDNEISGNIAIDSGATLIVSADISLAGNLTNNGTLTHSAGAINFRDATIVSTISSASDLTFVDLKSTSPGKVIKFEKHTADTPKFTISGSFHFDGADGNPIVISSDTPNSQWLVHFNINQNNVTYVKFKDTACNTATASILSNVSIVDGGNNGECLGFIEIGSLTPSIENEKAGGGSLQIGGSKKPPANATEIEEISGEIQTGGDVSASSEASL